jgi:hypothetical protein
VSFLKEKIAKKVYNLEIEGIKKEKYKLKYK